MTLVCVNPRCTYHTSARQVTEPDGTTVWRYVEGFQTKVPKAEARRLDGLGAGSVKEDHLCAVCQAARLV